LESHQITAYYNNQTPEQSLSTPAANFLPLLKYSKKEAPQVLAKTKPSHESFHLMDEKAKEQTPKLKSNTCCIVPKPIASLNHKPINK
jgi:hypothetical protein